ncbi:hypothetical protein BDZ97DRAFT_1940113 [Flammula alnicola]|nr:hypothetical protein BDZ97DRAFT_1940113 [Flammula alnicola]
MAEVRPPALSADMGPSIEPLYQVKLLSALRNGDPAVIHPFLTEISKDKRKSVDGDVDTGAAALHLAVRCGSSQTVALLLAHRAISPNGIHPPGSGTTPLHLAASLGRLDIVNLLLEQENIDDSLRDSHGKTCRDVARGKDIVRAIDDSRHFLNASYRSLLRSYILSPITDPPSPALIQLLESPRVKFVDLSYLDDDSGTSLLHEAARRKDLRLIELAVRAGADVFIRNRRGKMAYEGSGKDDRVKVFLRQFANYDKTLIANPAPLTEPPVLKGYLNKYTNVAKGYNTRWFVLKNGVLSYYRHQDDETVASRGSISMKTAVLHPSERTRFEVHSLPSRGHNHSSSGVQKWYLKANHPVEAHRWTEAITKSIEWYRQREGPTDSDGSSINASLPKSQRRKSAESDSSGVKTTPSMQSQSLSGTLWRKSAPGGGGKDQDSMMGSSYAYVDSPDASPNLMENDVDGRPPVESVAAENDAGDEDNDGEDSSSANSETKFPPHHNYELQGNAASAQLELTAQLLANPICHPTPRNEHLKLSLREREEWWARQLKKERARQQFWEESLAVVVKRARRWRRSCGSGADGEAAGCLGRALRVRSRRDGEEEPTLLGLPSSFTLAPSPVVEEPPSPSPVAERTPPPTATPATAKFAPVALPPVPSVPVAATAAAAPRKGNPHRGLGDARVTPSKAAATTTEEYEHDTDEEDEFFDAIDVVTVADRREPLPKGISLEPYKGYEHLRSRLAIGNDHRPSTSLWSVLKHSIGKDLTKISFPVFFNEPTSMLQRMAEDMEFSECLDVAAHEKDPLRRIAFVGAFAMSNYSSTIGRIAKPFNPMLPSPPISACWAESPAWHYYGEFMGKSFEIRPTGVAHANLLLAEEMAPHYPRVQGENVKSKVVEHYSWKKVTTNVSGFILGSPTIDHYGDMVITNHRTGDQCILTFKPRGWRGRDAYEISGQVVDAMAEPFLAPTDCRLRPDQRAFELGKYELANGLKQEQEEKQRSIRRQRDDGTLPPHRPRWFAAETDGDTGERVWTPVRVKDHQLEYWVERERVWRQGGNQPWKDVDDVFIEEPEIVKELMTK